MSCALLYVIIFFALEWPKTWVIAFYGYLFLFADSPTHLHVPLRAARMIFPHVQLLYLLIFGRRAILSCIAYFGYVLRGCITFFYIYCGLVIIPPEDSNATAVNASEDCVSLLLFDALLGYVFIY